MGEYASAQNTAALLIAKKGMQVTVRRKVPGTFDPVTQDEPDATVQSEFYDAVILPPGRDAQFRVGTLEGRKAVECYLSLKGRALGPVLPGDVISTPYRDYSVFWSRSYDPAGGEPIMTLAYAE
jgi:hypothetical protein